MKVVLPEPAMPTQTIDTGACCWEPAPAAVLEEAMVEGSIGSLEVPLVSRKGGIVVSMQDLVKGGSGYGCDVQVRRVRVGVVWLLFHVGMRSLCQENLVRRKFASL